MSSRSASAFRSDIEGLRALAVLLVVACHAGVPGLGGGFVGVDVFFVISGYLVTRLLLAEQSRQGRMDIAEFYARRVRRLLPAFGLMLFAVIGASWVVYSPLELMGMLVSAFAAALYFSNVHYAAAATDYMAPSAKLDPLLHTWSLGVEEQFYLAWPLILIAALWLGRRRNRPQASVATLIAGLGLLSFAACVLLTHYRQPLAFFLPFTRAWEFCLGAAVLLLEQRAAVTAALHRRRLPNRLALAGAGLLLLPALLLSSHSAFPGVNAALPALGTALLLYAVPQLASGHPLGRMLGLAPLQWLGKLSYGWYLWHWPMLVIGHVILPDHGLPLDLALVLAALLAAQLSYVLVEHPIRISPRFRRRGLAFAAAVLIPLCCVLLVQTLGVRAGELAGSPRFEHFAAAYNDKPLIYANEECDEWFYSSRLVPCIAGVPTAKRTVVLLGDSHAGQWFTALQQIATQAGWRLVVMTKSACPVVDQDFFYERIGRTFRECTEWRNAALAEIRRLRPAMVITSNSENYPFASEEWRAGISRSLAALAASTPRLIVLRDTPRPGFDALNCLARREWNARLSWDSCAFATDQVFKDDVRAAYEQAAQQLPNVTLVDMTSVICQQDPCAVATGTTFKFRDDSHLTDTFVREITPQLRVILASTGLAAR
jgi:peptidoglycan/LPS O-acetylase OafA/YrhL